MGNKISIASRQSKRAYCLWEIAFRLCLEAKAKDIGGKSNSNVEPLLIACFEAEM